MGGSPVQRGAHVVQLGAPAAQPGVIGHLQELGGGAPHRGLDGAGLALARGDQIAFLPQHAQRVLTLRLQQAVAARRSGVINLDQAAFDQHVQAFDQRPFVDVGAVRLPDRQAQAEAADKHTQPAEQGLLLRPQQAVAPVERGEQRLLVQRCVAAARSEQLQSLVQACHHASQAQQRQARCGQADGQRQPFKAAAQLDHQAQVGRPQREQTVPGTGLIDKQRHRPTAARLGQRRSGRWHVQAGQPEHLLGLDVQRRLARHQHPQARRRVQHRRHQPRDASDQVLGVVQHQQGRYRCQGGQQARQRVTVLGNRQAQRAGHRGSQQQRVGQWGQIDPGRFARRLGRQRPGGGHRDGRLAHTASADDGDQPVLRQQRAQVGQVRSAAQQRAACGGQRRRALPAPIRRRPVQRQQQIAPARGRADDPVPVAAKRRPQIADGPRE